MITNIGDELKKQREKNKLTLEDVEHATKIRIKNLTAIEEGNWDFFPSRTYIQGIISSYGKFLELDEQKLIAYFRREYEQRDQLKFKARTTKEQFTPQAKKMIKMVIILIIIAFVGYFGYQLKLYYTPPKVVIIEPKQTLFSKDKITLKGSTEKDSTILVNEEEVFLNEKNIFETEIPLPDEKNEVIIEVIGANGRKTVVKKVYLKK
ncbi:hypothetical protein A3H80_05215 [Candidatus Roizmanbacteria bacterium RIFCSPLOWO2_02_FULL_37_19]|uniref:HTH cro/C1-type domain-containing protein n=1 Tax=Candidatus Roizmanbacteria bacterium RIFCSPHIGHO2_02_FULL_37_24 TaxID=1802037 RepID=A0A1F7GX95_9BACT|nr:MAG: hypothetical protein A2862_01085 [Candidatus Roizmanbacteria bacterium RIFCSPHIGHO2_01_FULL_38_41]OGK23619.1 MAG: hypothetical protein A3C24_05460 [Candidatus Roizmanbacteria bacterium RIFCSPHIGHO2_02_FULL_37_24]OGK32942.1 MAG: hypothetical protein A3E10_05505 [Candidatus Roizmanbacteria bacterium RIFCSPHIGHO2_12_FULL_37_23]OGK44005.1 MAG: hypothetical protein A2956_01155 [Candidatus Roizmanbacteria bacterium RIFCSPLOWO2_01_FULL_37_57]OGK54652.1 MAG: hypothetical protein A3H80_05215 [Ca